MTDNKETAERILALVNYTAMLALEKTGKEREEFFVMQRQEFIDEAINTGLSEDTAQEWAETMDKMVQNMIGLIEGSGGGAGGEA